MYYHFVNSIIIVSIIVATIFVNVTDHIIIIINDTVITHEYIYECVYIRIYAYM